MAYPFILCLRDDTTVVTRPDGAVELRGPQASWTLHKPSDGVRRVIAALISGAGEAALGELAAGQEGSVDLTSFYYLMEKLRGQQFLCYGVRQDGTWLAKCQPMTAAFVPGGEGVASGRKYVLSRFAVSRREGGRTIMESPLACCRLVLCNRLAAAVVHRLAAPTTAEDLATEFSAADGAAALLQLLVNTGFAYPADEDEDETTRQWEYHDLLFHYRSRPGRHNYPVGGNFRFWGEIEPLPATKPPMSAEYIELTKPDLERLKGEDYPFSLILEERRSIREYGKPITAEQVGEFLYRTARLRQIIEPDLGRGLPYQASNRPYPGGGACYELELYLTVRESEGLAPGLYHYQPGEHRLYRLSGETAHTRALLQEASDAAARMCSPQVLITIAARFPRVTWKYSSIAYAVILKNVGVLYQTMYLVATAMDLAPCALGAGNADLLARAAGLDDLAESAVGEFMLGTKRI